MCNSYIFYWILEINKVTLALFWQLYTNLQYIEVIFSGADTLYLVYTTAVNCYKALDLVLNLTQQYKRIQLTPYAGKL